MAEAKLKITTETGDSKADLDALIARIEALEKANKDGADSVQRLEKELEQMRNSTKKSEQASESFVSKLGSLGSAFMGLKQLVGPVFDKVMQGLEEMAGSGDKNAQAMLGSFKKLQDSIKPLIGVFVEQLLPSISMLVEATGPLISEFSKWIKESGAVEKSIDGLVTALQVVLSAAGTVLDGWKMLLAEFDTTTGLLAPVGQAFEWLGGKISEAWGVIQAALGNGGVFGNAIGIMKAFVAEAMGIFAELTSTLADQAYRVSTDMGDALKITSNEWAKSANIWRKEALDAADGVEQANTKTIGSMDSVIGALENFKNKNSSISEELKNDYASRSQAAIEATATQNEEEKKLQEEMADFVLGLEQETAAEQERINQESKEKLKTSLEEDFVLQQEASAKKIEQMLLDAQLTATTQEDLKNKILEINAQIVSSDEFTSAQRQAAAQVLAEHSRSTNETLRQEATKTAQVQAQKAEEARKKVTDSVLNMAKTMLNSQMTMKEKAAAIFDEMTKLITDALLKQLSMTISTSAQGSAAKSAAAATNIATSKAETIAEAASVPPKVASSFAGLGPLGMGLAAIALSFFMGMIKTKVGLESGGAPSGSVPGLGRSDNPFVDYNLNSKEHVVNEQGTRAFGREALDYANATGMNPFTSGGSSAGGGASGPLEITVRHVFEGIPSSIESFLAPWMPDLTKAISDHVLRRSGTLVASTTRNPRVRTA